MNSMILKIARNAIKEYIGQEIEILHLENSLKIELDKKRATFVTITIGGKLRGCIGSLEPNRTIYDDVTQNAISAAFKDPRFPPIKDSDIDNLEIEVSILSPLTQIPFKTEEEIISTIVPFKMGLLLEYGFNRGTFLPQVWSHYPEPSVFFNNLKLKSGLPYDFFSPEMKLFYYEVEKWRE